MKKRLFALLLSTLLVFSLIPAAAFAAGTEGATGEITEAESDDTVTVESVQALIDALPEAFDITADNAEEAEAALDAIDEARNALYQAGGDVDDLNCAKYDAVCAALAALAGEMTGAVTLADNGEPVDYGFSVYNSAASAAVEATSDNAADVLGDGTISYDAATNTLTLNNASLTSPYPATAGALVEAAINVNTSGQSLNIELIGENTIAGGRCINVSGSLTISGTGSLNAEGQDRGVYAGGDLTIDGTDGATVTASTTTSAGGGIEAQGTLTIQNGATVTGTSSGADGIYGNNGITIEDSTVTGSSTSSDYYAGISSQGNISITNSTVTAESATDAGLAAYNGNLTITNSTVDATAGYDADGYGYCAICGNTITISGGSVTATDTGKEANAIYSFDGSIAITNGAAVTAKATNGESYPAVYGTGGVSISDSNVTAEAGGDVAVYSPADISIHDSIVTASAPNGLDGIMARGNSSVSGSWISTSGTEDFDNSIADSVLINGTTGSVIGNAVLPGSVTLPTGTTLNFPDSSSLTVPDGVTFTNNGIITGSISITNNGTVICTSHVGGTATCAESAVCEVCGERYGDVNAANHTNLVETEAEAATHLTTGNTQYWYCDGCDKYFSDAAGTQVITLDDTVIPKLTEHTTEIQNAKAATCTEAGYTGDTVCTVCGETIETGEVIPATGHVTEVQNAKAAACTEAGYTGDTVCTVCGETIEPGEAIPATGHNYGEPAIIWAEDYSAATVTFTCANDGGHQETVTATVTSAVKTPATAAEKGVTVYTATITFNGTEYTFTAEAADIPGGPPPPAPPTPPPPAPPGADKQKSQAPKTEM
ncbi:MAG: carbohydrate-binding domain-containing protein [Oscillospiraceae bacterium]|nr:carbohydrate-binding domain-containing protein [Oscillospiraceae bacterium]